MHDLHPALRWRGVMLVAAGAVIAGGVTVAANAGGYPIKCVNNTAITVNHSNGATTSHPSIQEAVDAASGDASGSSVGDTVIVCHGTFTENVAIGDPMGDPDSKANLTLRSYDGTDQTKVVAADPAQPVITVNSNGVVVGGPGLGLYLTGSNTGIQVGADVAPNLSQSDDQPVPCPQPETTVPPTCDDKESPAATPINVSIIGNRIRDLTATSGAVTGIAVFDSNNTLVYRNLIERASVNGAGIVYGIRYADTNAGNHVLQNAIHQLTQFGDCGTGSTTENPTAGVVGVSIDDEALDGLVHDTLVDNLSSSCTAVGIYSNAWGGLENDRNGQQIPIATDLVGNRVTKISGGTADSQEAAVSIAPVPPQNTMGGDMDDTNPPSSFRVLANDLQDSAVSVAVWTQLAAYSYIEENDFDHDGIGVFNNGDMNLDATNNWWGCQEGPTSGKKECATIGGGAAAATSFNPWLRSHVDHAGEHAGEWAGHG
jgi:hypothetical protein